MGNTLRGLAKRDVVAKYLLFFAGVQISVSVQLFLSVYFAQVPLRKFTFIMIAGFALGVSSLISLMFAGEVEHVVKAGASVVGTTLEKKRDDIMNEALDETATTTFPGLSNRINKIKAFFWTDVFLCASGLVIAILGRP